jgi:hypothetical protein
VIPEIAKVVVLAFVVVSDVTAAAVRFAFVEKRLVVVAAVPVAEVNEIAVAHKAMELLYLQSGILTLLYFLSPLPQLNQSRIFVNS